ncbi:MULTISPECIES: HU family DNA-binding protein [Methylobacterium]|uniref:HU family DNA-binding protein n=1 Tax=Methylobacterium longum TaxID=767694 RepID=A0ABT8ATC1_9HYPH|nr:MULTISPECIES: HU family DNA-binding protein [Methylobacterium]MCJ2102214.1 HU family DNA-binding protein [Methylobacterium sp. E-046]MDN3573172.1 HU family DNA-binding protein [Methylobacterium longum]
MVRAVLDRIAEALADGDRVELREVGAFSGRAIEPHIGRDPRTGEGVRVAAKRHVSIKSREGMPAQLNRGDVKPQAEAAQRQRAYRSPRRAPPTSPAAKLSLGAFERLRQAEPTLQLRRQKAARALRRRFS